ncbi:ABC transporter permease [Streptacidiphilus carbonis]|jgi:ABC-2 type transport system permease protein|uniref:ABC transporter permease n=1 Tax=Streptacidiphilus carbonis TaxID=105422 RepID=UPI000AEADAFA|nr:ABC transporter permease [Streptacidiphilus carbonis]
MTGITVSGTDNASGTRGRSRAVSGGHYRFRHAARMEWVKLRTLRSTWWTLGITAVGAVAIGVGVGAGTRDGSGDLTNNALVGMVPGLLLTGVLGVLVTTAEYSSGMIRSTLAAIPRRPLALAAKAAVFGALALAFGELASFASFFAGGAALGHGIAAPTLGRPGVLRAVVFSGMSFALIGLIGVGLGAIVRHTAAAIAMVVGGVYVLGQVVGALAHAAAPYMPILIVANSLSTTRPPTCSAGSGSCPQMLSAWSGLGMLGLYAAVVLVIGGWLLARRDA